MTETTKMVLKEKTVSVSSTPAPPKAKSARSVYQLHNDTNSHVSVYWHESGVPKGVFTLAPGATSDSYPSGDEIFILYIESGTLTPVVWNGWSSITYYYNTSGYPAHDGVNNVSSF